VYRVDPYALVQLTLGDRPPFPTQASAFRQLSKVTQHATLADL
jgi:hypothetical protein